MHRWVTFTVMGIARPKGSTKAFPFRRKNGKLGVSVKSDNPNLESWETAVANVVARECAGVFYDADTPIAVDILFKLPRPKSLPKKVTRHLKKPDLDKLARGALDAMKGVLWADDSQIEELHVEKQYAEGAPSAVFAIWPSVLSAPIAKLTPDLLAMASGAGYHLPTEGEPHASSHEVNASPGSFDTLDPEPE